MSVLRHLPYPKVRERGESEWAILVLKSAMLRNFQIPNHTKKDLYHGDSREMKSVASLYSGKRSWMRKAEDCREIMVIRDHGKIV
jgi:hypothetical protein